MRTTSDSPAILHHLGLPLMALALVGLLAAGCGTPENENPPKDDAGEVIDDENTDGNTDGNTDKEDTVTPVDPGPLAEGACRVSVNAATDNEEWTPLCALDEGKVQHVRVEGMGVSAGGHEAAQILLGYDAAPSNAQATTAAGQLIIQMYAGTPKDLHIYYGDAYLAFRGTRAFTAGPSSLCFDLVGGSDTRAPALTLWISGENGADCRDFATLTKSSAWVTKDTWLDKDGAPVVGAVDRTKSAFAYQAKGVIYKPVVTLFPQSVASCETEWSGTTEIQELCEPAGGATRFLLEDVSVVADNSYFYLVTGETNEQEPATKTVVNDGKLVVNGGKSHMSESATFFPFDGVARPFQHVFTNDADDGLYVVEPTTICTEIALNAAGNANVLFWATGANGADCANPATLTRETLTHLETLDKPFAVGKKNYIKTSNANVSLGRVIVSNDRVAGSDQAPEGACRTEVASAATGAKFTPVCTLEEGTVQHVRVEGMGVGAGGHQASQLLLGADEAPASSQAAVEAGQLLVQMYAGTPNTLHLYFGDAAFDFDGTRDFTAGPSTLCFDLVGGSDTRAPALTLWVTGENKANCRDFTTLTQASAYLTNDTWLNEDDEPVFGDVAREKGAFLYQANGVVSTPVVTLFNKSVSSCETIWAENTDMQALCEPAGGATRFRVEDVFAKANSSYFYVVTGVDASDEAPTTSTAADDGKLVLNGGKSHLTESATFFPFDGVNRPTQHVFLTDAEDPLYIVGPNTVCTEIVNVSGKATVYFWATGANGADCAQASTLTKDSVTHTETFEKPFGAGKKNFVKASNSTNVSLTRVVVSNDRVAP